MSSSKQSLALPFEISASVDSKMTLIDYNEAYLEACNRISEIKTIIDGGYGRPQHPTGMYNAIKDRSTLAQVILAKIEEELRHNYWQKDELNEMGDIIATQMEIDCDTLRYLEHRYPTLRPRMR